MMDRKGIEPTERIRRRGIEPVARRSVNLHEGAALAQLVARKLRLEWSPEQIAGWLKRTYPDDEAFQVSHETIYRSLFI